MKTKVNVIWSDTDVGEIELDLSEYCTREEAIALLYTADATRRDIKRCIRKLYSDYTTVEHGEIYRKKYIELRRDGLHRYFNRGHFPVGTVCQIETFEEPFDVTVAGLFSNGAKSWVIRVIKDNEPEPKIYNIDHVRKIHRRGTGNAVVLEHNPRYSKEGYYSEAVWSSGSNRTHYQLRAPSLFFAANIAEYDTQGDHLYSEERLEKSLIDLGVLEIRGWETIVNKRRLRKYFKTAMARAKISRKKEQKYEHELWNRSFDDN